MNRKKAMDHRTRVGQERSNRTRLRILDAAMRVFAEKGPDAPVIQDFIIAADMSRGTFYNYFNSIEELLIATSKQLEDDLIVSIQAEIESMPSPVERMTFGMLLWLQKAADDPTWCAFVNRVAHHSPIVETQVGADLRDGMARGEFFCPDIDAAYDMIVGTLRQAMNRMMAEKVPQKYPKLVVQTVLQGLGVAGKQSNALLELALPKMRRPARTISRVSAVS
jgi:AcrR family transcriptional regulator